jgi:hypothetical protein
MNSFILDIVKFGLGKFGIQASGNTPSAIAQSAITNFLVDKVTKTVKKTNPQVLPNTVATTPAAGSVEPETKEVRAELELTASPDNPVPLVYGEGYVKGVLSDAYLSNDGCVMWFSVVICEKTGNLIDGTPSVITIEDIFWDDQKVTVQTDGNTVAALWDGRPGSYTPNTDISGQVRIYLYNDGSESPTNIRTQGIGVQHGNAYDLFPTWTSNHQMSNLVFALIRVDYNSYKNVSGPKNVTFRVKNTMTKPGDVMYDYLTNDIYGAGVPASEVNI